MPCVKKPCALPTDKSITIINIDNKKEKAMIFLKHQVSLQMAEKKSCATGKVWKESERKRIGVWRAPERERDG